MISDVTAQLLTAKLRATALSRGQIRSERVIGPSGELACGAGRSAIRPSRQHRADRGPRRGGSISTRYRAVRRMTPPTSNHRDLTRREALNRGGRVVLGASAAPAAATLAGYVSQRARRKASANWGQLGRSLRGPLLRPGDTGFRAASAAENDLYASVVPAGIALCAGAKDVQTCVRWARENGVPLVARSGGHSFGGYSRTTGLQVDLRRMKSVTVDPHAGTMRATGAVRFSDLDAALKPHNLFIPAGQCPPVGLNGFTLGGGFGFYSRTHGLAVDHLTQTQVVLASGEMVTADHSHHSDLFWGCRGGGGGNFGINTSMTFSLFPVGKVSVCTCEWSTNLEAVLDEFQALFDHVPDTFSLIVRITPAGQSAQSSGPTVTALGHYFGPSRELRDILAPVLSVAPASRRQFFDTDFWTARRYLADLPGPPHSYVERSRYVAGPMSNTGVATVLDWTDRWPRRAPAEGRLDYWLWGGAMNAPSPSSTAFVHRRDTSLFAVSAGWAASTSRRRVRPAIDWVNDTWAALGPHATDSAYQNFIDPALKRWQHAYYGTNLRRLIKTKRTYDRHNLFNFPQSIPT
jgi:FAD/FMN-containing dehydrogenase